MDKHKYIQTLLKYPTAWEGHGIFAMNLVEIIKPKVTVDLGVDYGFSTFCFAYPQIGDVYGIDWFKGDEHAGYRDTYNLVNNLYNEINSEFDISNVIFIKDDFTLASKKWNKKIDILHIDGFHSYEAISTDYNNWINHCHEESIILFHDTISFPDTIGKFFEELQGFKFNKTNSAGLGVFTKSEITYNKIKNVENN
jgi:hypothetical protein